MDYDLYDGDVASFTVDLIATRPTDRFPEELNVPNDLRRLVDTHGLRHAVPAAPPDQEDLRRVREIRDELADVFDAPRIHDAVNKVNAVLRDSHARPQLTDHDGIWHLHYVSEQPSWPNTIGSMAATVLAHVLAQNGLERFGECADDDCETYFIDASRNLSRRYCCQRCGTRAAVKAYRSRQADSEAEHRNA